ncbi:hypothetical protein J8J22_21880, partial [Mycobacterium tuberculosis]|nr:hypothetical protein [Mycobacterium tuberculosis]
MAGGPRARRSSRSSRPALSPGPSCSACRSSVPSTSSPRESDMVDAALINECADPALKPAIVEKFVEAAGSEDPLAITVRAGNRVVLV